MLHNDRIDEVIRSEKSDRVEIFWDNRTSKVDIIGFNSVDFTIKNQGDGKWISQETNNYVEFVKYLISVGYHCL